MEEAKPTDVAPDFRFNISSGSDEYVPAPVDQPLKAHVRSIRETKQVDEFKTRPDGSPNPNYGKEKQILVFGFKLDESDAKGQVYTAWVSNNVSERSNLGRISKALFGDHLKIATVAASEILGLPLRITLRPGKRNPDRLNVDVEKLFGPTEDQKRVEVEAPQDTLIDDLPDDPFPEEKMDEAFGPAAEEAA